MESLFPALRLEGAFLGVCSGFAYSDGKGILMREVGFCEGVEPESVYCCGNNKAAAIIESLRAKGRSFSKIIFVDNRLQNVTDCVKGLRKHFSSDTQATVPQIIGVHYHRFHTLYMNPALLLAQKKIIEAWVRKERQLEMEAARNTQLL